MGVGFLKRVKFSKSIYISFQLIWSVNPLLVVVAELLIAIECLEPLQTYKKNSNRLRKPQPSFAIGVPGQKELHWTVIEKIKP